MQSDQRYPRPVVRKTQTDLTHEWDRIAKVRNQQIASGKDLSYRHVLVPAINSLSKGCDLEGVLDLGCGTGQLAAELARISASVTAVDVSSRSIEIAQETCAELTNTSFVVSSVEEFAEEWTGPLFTTAVANMTLMTCLNLQVFIESISRLLVPNGHFIASITHPFFWPYHHGYANADWFNYDQEILIEAPFIISTESTNYVTTHIHRPLTSYFNSLFEAGFVVESILEPYPDNKVQTLYPDRWTFPRFLIFRALMTAPQ